ncbi:hypothetical protein ACHAQA_010058 [Verticillium albo-atrum]
MESSTAQHVPSDGHRESRIAPESQLPLPTHSNPQHQAYVPQHAYQHPPQPQQPLFAPAPNQPRLVPFHRTWHIAKILLRLFDIVSSIVVIALTLSLLSITFSRASVPLILSLPAACICLLWETAELITLCARGGKLGIHPGAHVALHLLIWLYWAVGIAFLCIFSIMGFGSLENAFIGSEIAILVFSIIASLINFTLFVRGCVETNQRNRQRGQIYVMTGNGRGPFYVMSPQQQGQLPQMQQFGAMQQYPHPAMPSAVYGQVRAPQARDSKAPAVDHTLPPSNPEATPRAVVSPADGSFYGPGNPYQQQA